jgi:hypothetical protein
MRSYGTRVLASHTLELEDGRIAREWLVQAWDGQRPVAR